MLNSLRSLPLEPPSSVTVTTAVRSVIPGRSVATAELGTSMQVECGAYFLRPRKRVESPVPPPIATTLSERASGCDPLPLRASRETFPALPGVSRGAVLVECSTLTVGWVQELAHAVEARGCELIENLFVAPSCPPWIQELVEKVLQRYGVGAAVVQSALDAKPMY